MEISDIDQEITDFDWYAVDLNGYLVQFSSGGGTLPASVAASSEALAQLTHYFLTLTETTAAHLNPDLLLLEPHLRTEDDLTLYAYSSSNYAKSGLFAFNKTDLSHQNNCYHLVAYPAKPLCLAELPPAIGALISRTRLPWAISGFSKLDASAIE